MEYTMKVPGLPRAKQRPRFTRNGGVYTPAETKKAEDNIAELYDGPLFEGPVEVECVFDKEETTIIIRGHDEERSKLRGDLDNYIKLILDGLNKSGAWEDDKQVHSINGVKK
tara:strand:- start:318 stop:653 length:336 start_codon:yes stop_codon:yes gene_type:complete